MAYLVLVSCSGQQTGTSKVTMAENSSQSSPKAFLPELTPEGLIIHGGSFSPDLKQYYFTLSDSLYSRFDVKMIEQEGDAWAKAKTAFFNSDFSEHGAKFSPDGKALYFSSTRPTGIEGITDTWHLWVTKRLENGWSTPLFIDIPNLRDKLVSHPSITEDGTLYFHASKLDYKEMTLYSAEWQDGKYSEAKKLTITESSLACTPYITPDGQTLLYAAIGEQLDLMISRKTAEGTWDQPERLNDQINTNGQGNPYMTPDGNYLFYTSNPEPTKWQVNRVSTEGWLK